MFRIVPPAACTQVSVVVTQDPLPLPRLYLWNRGLGRGMLRILGLTHLPPVVSWWLYAKPLPAPHPPPPPTPAPRTEASLRVKQVTAQCQVCLTLGGRVGEAGCKKNRSFVFPKELASFTMGRGVRT